MSVLSDDGYAVTACGCAREAEQLLRRGVFDIVLLDWYMSRISGRELVPVALASHPAVKVVAVTGKASVASSLDAMAIGAWAYVAKPFSAMYLQIVVGHAAYEIAAARESVRRQQELEAAGSNSDKILVLGRSPAFRSAIARARRAAATDASVLLTGESGCGKELFAQFIHRHSSRADKPFLAVNCAALPEPLLESEMFGHRRGAFTGAVREKPGLLEAAHDGTLMLDELAEMPKTVQAKLLRVLQDGVVRRVGSEAPDAVVNVRFIAATNREVEQAVIQGVLREDLFYRLAVVPIRIPPLRERLEDVELLANAFLHHYWHKYRGTHRPVPRLTTNAVRALRAHPWPGNVRELQNLMEHAVVLLESAVEIGSYDLPFRDLGMSTATSGADSDDTTYYDSRDRLLERFDRVFVRRAIERAGGNYAQAARRAGIDRTTFYRLVDRHGLQREARAR